MKIFSQCAAERMFSDYCCCCCCMGCPNDTQVSLRATKCQCYELNANIYCTAVMWWSSDSRLLLMFIYIFTYILLVLCKLIWILIIFLIKESILRGLHTQLQQMFYKLWAPKVRNNKTSYDTCIFQDTKRQINDTWIQIKFLGHQ